MHWNQQHWLVITCLLGIGLIPNLAVSHSTNKQVTEGRGGDGDVSTRAVYTHQKIASICTDVRSPVAQALRTSNIN